MHSANLHAVAAAFHEWAGLSIGNCRWAKALYDAQIAKVQNNSDGQVSISLQLDADHLQALVNHAAYDDVRFIERLKQTGDHPYTRSCSLTRQANIRHAELKLAPSDKPTRTRQCLTGNVRPLISAPRRSDSDMGVSTSLTRKRGCLHR